MRKKLGKQMLGNQEIKSWIKPVTGWCVCVRVCVFRTLSNLAAFSSVMLMDFFLYISRIELS